jgi:glycosyltransferase involved in cell wall biosynthesis
MKIAYLVNQYPKVSHTFIRREIRALERTGIEVLRFALRGWDNPLADPEDICERECTRYVLRDGIAALALATLRQALSTPRRFAVALRLALKMSRRAHRPLAFHLAYLAEACWLAPQLEAAQARHLHAHFGTNSAEVAMLVHTLSGVGYSFTVHGADELDRPEFIGLAEKIRRSAFVVAISSFCRGQLLRWVEHEQWNKVRVVYCGIEREFHDVPRTAIPDLPRLVCVGRLCGEKGQHLLLDAAAVLAREAMDFEIVLAGDGEMRPQLEAAIARLGLERRIRITGWISSAQVRDEISAARTLVLPSFYEGLPIVIMEAMALRRPVLTTYVAGIPELVVHGETGWLIPAGEIDELVAAIRRCLTTPSNELARMGEKGYERVLARHDADRQAERLARLFREAAPARASAGSWS